MTTHPRRPRRPGSRAQVLAEWRADLHQRAVGAVLLAGGRVVGTELAATLGVSAHGLRRVLEGCPALAFTHEHDPQARRAALVVLLVYDGPTDDAEPGASAAVDDVEV